MFCDNYDSFVKNLERHAFTVHSAADGAEAKKIALDLIGNGSAGIGGSMTVDGLGIPAALREKGNAVFFHWGCKPEERDAIFEAAAHADWYVCSANAITRNAKIINIDGNGNRVSGTFFGPQKVILVIGKNKFAEDLDSGMARAKRYACSQNARRLNFSSPCALTDKCADCCSPQRICKITTIIEYLPGLLDEMHLVLVDEALGY